MPGQRDGHGRRRWYDRRDVTVPRPPRILVAAAGEPAERLSRLFSSRGFDVVVSEDDAAVRAFVLDTADDPTSFAAVVDLRHIRGVSLLAILVSAVHRPVLVGIVDQAYEVKAVNHVVDAGFALPLDPALLFVSVVDLLSRRREASGRRPGRQARLTGLVGRIEGNSFFQRMVDELQAVILPVNAGAILEHLCEEVGTRPHELTPDHAHAMFRSGLLEAALARFAQPEDIATLIERLRHLVRERAARSR